MIKTNNLPTIEFTAPKSQIIAKKYASVINLLYFCDGFNI